MRKFSVFAAAILVGLLFGACALGDVFLPAALRSIEDEAYMGDTGLKGVLVIPEGCESIGSNAFRGCTGLTGLVLPSTVKKIGDRAFYGCTGLSGVIYPAGGVSISSTAFEGTKITLGVRVSGIVLEDTVLSCTAEGAAVQIASAVFPENATVKDLIWKSSDTAVVRVSEGGMVSAVAPGTARVTAEAADGGGVTGSCTVTVLPELVITAQTGDVTAAANESVVLEVTPYGGTGEYACQWYYCGDENAAGVKTYTGRRISLIAGAGEGTFWYYCVVSSGNQSVTSDRIRITVTADTIGVSPAAADAVAADGKSYSLNITSAVAWTAVSDSTWLTVDPAAGSGNAAVTLTAAPNTSGTARQGSVTFTCGSAAAVHTVYQANYVLNISPTAFESVSPEGCALASAVTSGLGSWTAGSDSSWLAVVPAQGSGYGFVSFIATENLTGEARTAEVAFTSGNLTKKVSLTQEPYSLTLSPETDVSAPAAGGSLALTVSVPYGTWSAEAGASWLTLSSSSGGDGETALTLTCAQNTASARSAVITFTVGSIKKSLTVTQASGNAYIAPSVTALSVSQKGSPYIGTSYAVYDCQAFVERCLADAGLEKDLAGSNAWYREMNWRGTPEECIMRFGYIPKGAFLFIVVHDGGEPAIYSDDLGNADHIGIYTGTGKGAIHSSYVKQAVCESYFPCATVEDSWNMVGLWDELDYGDENINRFLSGR